MKESFRRVPTSVQRFNIVLPLIFLVAAGWAVAHCRIVPAAGLAAIFVLTYLVEPLPNPSGGRIFPNNSVKIAAALLWLPQEVLLGVGIGSFIGLILFRDYEMWRAGGNGAAWGLSAGAATLVAHLAIPQTSPTIAHLAGAAILAVVSNRVINEGIFSIYKSHRFGHPFLATWLQNVLDQWPSQLFAAPMGIILAAIAVRSDSIPLALALTAVSAIALPVPRQELAYYHRSQQTLAEIVEAMVRALEGVDENARAHGDRVSALAVKVGSQLGMSEQALRAVRLASRLHDVGLLAGPDAPSDDIRLERHPAVIGGRILARFPDPMIGAIVRAHHERWDGQGIPDHKSGKAIPFGARILAAAEVYDSAVHGLSPFTAPLSREAAAGYLVSIAGSALDPQVVKALLRVAAGQSPEVAR